jgi:hypothetical protein
MHAFIRVGKTLGLVAAIGSLAQAQTTESTVRAAARRFLEQTDAGNVRTVYRSSVCSLWSQQTPEETWVSQITPLIVGRQGAPKQRTIVDEKPAPPNPQVTGGSVTAVRFRSVYPAATVYEDVYIQQLSQGGTCVAGFYVSPAPF